MEELEKLLREIILDLKLIEGNLSNPRKRNEKTYIKVDIKPVLIRDEIKIQFTYNYKEKVSHENLDLYEAMEKLMELFREFRQGMIFTPDNDYQILISKRGKVKILRKKATKEKVDLSHNRKKRYIIEEGKPCDFLIKLGVMTKEGRVVARRYDKFKQINRFLEMVEDIIPELKKEGTINIIDFGCGKSYLTFALYYYLVDLLKLDINIIGLDLKEDVIKFCNQVART